MVAGRLVGGSIQIRKNGGDLDKGNGQGNGKK